MTEKLFDNGMLMEFDAKVISCTEIKKGWEIVLDRTAADRQAMSAGSEIPRFLIPTRKTARSFTSAGRLLKSELKCMAL